MSEKEESFCRLCAEPTPRTQLISSDEDVAISSKISTKMQWINIDITSSDILPRTICFSCFDLLERTWQFLHNVRSAQEKLLSIFCKATDQLLTTEIAPSVGKPVNENWDRFINTKKEIKNEDIEADFITTVDPETLMLDIKPEKNSDDGDSHNGFNSTDSDLPLVITAKKKKKLKKKCKDRSKTDKNVTIQLPIQASWENNMCQCAHCDAQCKNIASLRLHALEIHSSCCIFKCSYCDKVVANYKYFINHVRMHNNLLRYCCDICDEQFTLPSEVKKHREFEHRSVAICSNCGAIYDSSDQLQEHLASYSKGLVKRRKKEKFETELKCDRCNKEFKSRSNLLQHRLVHTERSRDFSCHVCGKMFFTKGALSTHMLTHEEVKPFKCEFCPMTFRARGNLHSHASLHSGAKPFVCEQCGKSFRVKRHLKSHSIVHTDLMPYVCQYCNKTFRFKTRLNLHLRQHTGAKPYHCVYCERDFTNGSNYKKHMKRRHNIDTSKKKYNNIVEPENISMSLMPVK